MKYSPTAQPKHVPDSKQSRKIFRIRMPFIQEKIFPPAHLLLSIKSTGRGCVTLSLAGSI